MGQKTQDSTTIGINLKAVREAAHLTVPQVAYKSGVAERTVQRAEAGDPIREENLQALCQTLGIPIENVRIDWTNPPEHIQKRLLQGSSLHPVKAKRLLTALDVDGYGAPGLSIFHRDERLSEEAQGLAAEIQQSLQDMVDVLSGMEHTMQWEEAKRIAGLLGDLEALGGALVVGLDTLHLKPTKYAPSATPVGLAVCAYVPVEAIPRSVVYDRRTLGPMFQEHEAGTEAPAPTS